MNRGIITAAIAVTTALPVLAGDTAPSGAASVYDFEMTAIDGKSVKLSRYQGDVLMIVNVASK